MEGTHGRKATSVTRRDLLKAMVTAGAAVSWAGIGGHSRTGAAPMDEPRAPDRDRHGGWLHTAAGRFRDEHGQPVLLRGVNLGLYHDEPFDCQEADFERIGRWGFNAVRVPVRWDRIEPRRAVYDEGYLEGIDRYVAWARRNRLWVILGLFGWPPWWAQDAEDRQRYAPPAGSPEARWISWLWTRPGFYLDKRDSHSRFVALWRKLAERYRDESAICLYELLNEPERTVHLPPEREDDLVYSLYEQALRAIREVDRRHIVGYMPVGLENIGQSLGFRPVVEPNVCVTYHFYLHDYDYWQDPRPERLREAVARIYQQAQNSQLPLLVTEFGCHQEATKAQPWIRDVLALWKEYDVGHLWWCYMKSDRPLALLDSGGQVRRHIIELLTDWS